MITMLLSVLAAIPPPAVEPASVIQLPVDLKVLLQAGSGALITWLLAKVTAAGNRQREFKEKTDKQLAVIETNLANLVKAVDRMDQKPT